MSKTTTTIQIAARSDLTSALAAATPAMRAVAVCLADIRGRLSPTAAKRAIRKMPAEKRAGFVITRHLNQALELAQRVRTVRKMPRRTGSRPWHARADQAKGRAALADRLQVEIQQRRDNHVFEALRRAARWVMKYGAPGGTNWNIAYTVAGEAPGYDLQCERVYGVYKGAYKGWAANLDVHTITVPRDWLSRVKRITQDGVVKERLILDAEYLVRADDDTRTVYRVLIARRGPGYRAVVETRYISCWPFGVTTLHATERAALSAGVPDEVRRREIVARRKEIQRALEETYIDARDADVFASLT
ncbi:hypothetical protein HPT29_018445 [Microvirga terrae]|uniref:Uncharacterized protein n=1 Tax=Microvirga terrae TaxID=2740529 RepID=A0ABY5RMJ8_9HYPH|nr:hypothetical protein [Microvirga terrae]UVF18453.1 hypothetical protein HPT29_018445 [Microvirga terrae]